LGGIKPVAMKLTKNMKIIQKIKKNNMNPGGINEISQEEEDKRNQRKQRFHKELRVNPTNTVVTHTQGRRNAGGHLIPGYLLAFSYIISNVYYRRGGF
jgi:hypothetical protein